MRIWQINVCSCQRIGGKSSRSVFANSLKIPTRGGGVEHNSGNRGQVVEAEEHCVLCKRDPWGFLQQSNSARRSYTNK